MFKCEQCPSVFTRKSNLTAHQKKHDGVRFPCTVCASTFTLKTNLNKHMKNMHGIVPAHRQPYAQLNQPAASIDVQPVRQSVIKFAPRVAPQGDIQIAPQIYVPNIPAGGSKTVPSNLSTNGDIRMTMMDENQELADTG